MNRANQKMDKSALDLIQERKGGRPKRLLLIIYIYIYKYIYIYIYIINIFEDILK